MTLTNFLIITFVPMALTTLSFLGFWAVFAPGDRSL